MSAGKNPLGFLNLKSFHPSNKANQRKLFIAEQKLKDDVKKEKDREQELAREQEVYKNMQLLKGGRSSAGNKEKATVQTAQAQMNFMYAPPPGWKPPKTEAEEKKDKSQSQSEQDVEKFPYLKDAPVEGKFTEDIPLRHKPFGIEVRNVRCARCHQWGHQSGDRECPMKDAPNPIDDSRRALEDPMHMSLLTGDNKDGLVLRRNALSPINRGMADNQQLLPENEVPIKNEHSDDNDDDVEREFLASLTRKQRRLLLKEFKYQERKKQKKKKQSKKDKKSKDRRGSGSSSESDSDSDGKQAKVKKESKEEEEGERKRKRQNEDAERNVKVKDEREQDDRSHRDGSSQKDTKDSGRDGERGRGGDQVGIKEERDRDRDNHRDRRDDKDRHRDRREDNRNGDRNRDREDRDRDRGRDRDHRGDRDNRDNSVHRDARRDRHGER